MACVAIERECASIRTGLCPSFLHRLLNRGRPWLKRSFVNRFFLRVWLDSFHSQAFKRGPLPDSHRLLRVPNGTISIHFRRIKKEVLKKKSEVSFHSIRIGTVLAVIVIGGAAALLLSRWPFTREVVVGALQEKFSSTLELKAFHGTYFPPGCIVEGVTFRRNSDRDDPPIATVEKLTIQGAYWEFFRTPRHLRRVKIEGLRMFISSGSERSETAAQPGSPK